MPVAVPLTKELVERVSSGVLVHVTDRKFLRSIITDDAPSRPGADVNCEVHLMAGQGWSVTPFRLFRDYSVFDPGVSNLKNWGRYVYFFLGEPSRWAVAKNISPLKRWKDIVAEKAIIRVPGHEFVAQAAGRMFYRPDDKAVVLRGDYIGPAHVHPLPSARS